LKATSCVKFGAKWKTTVTTVTKRRTDEVKMCRQKSIYNCKKKVVLIEILTQTLLLQGKLSSYRPINITIYNYNKQKKKNKKICGYNSIFIVRKIKYFNKNRHLNITAADKNQNNI